MSDRPPPASLLSFSFSQSAELAREAGGRVLLPATGEEVLEPASKVSCNVGARYVVTYTPLRAFRREGGDGGAPARRRERAPHGAATFHAAERRHGAAA